MRLPKKIEKKLRTIKFFIIALSSQISLNKQMKKAISNTPNRMKIVFEALSE